MKRIYSLYAVGLALVLAGGILLANPPSVLQPHTVPRCQYGGGVISERAVRVQTTRDVHSPTAEGTFTQNCTRKSELELEMELR